MNEHDDRPKDEEGILQLISTSFYSPMSPTEIDAQIDMINHWIKKAGFNPNSQQFRAAITRATKNIKSSRWSGD